MEKSRKSRRSTKWDELKRSDQVERVDSFNKRSSTSDRFISLSQQSASRLVLLGSRADRQCLWGYRYKLLLARCPLRFELHHHGISSSSNEDGSNTNSNSNNGESVAIVDFSGGQKCSFCSISRDSHLAPTRDRLAWFGKRKRRRRPNGMRREETKRAGERGDNWWVH